MARSALGRLLDLMVYAPVGVALQLRRALPELAEQGRAHLEGLVRPAARPALRPTPTRDTPVLEVGDEVDVPVLVEADAAPGELPLPGYDSLAASQVIALLADLDEAGLAAVAAHEARHRNRRTVLAKVAQLREG